MRFLSTREYFNKFVSSIYCCICSLNLFVKLKVNKNEYLKELQEVYYPFISWHDYFVHSVYERMQFEKKQTGSYFVSA